MCPRRSLFAGALGAFLLTLLAGGFALAEEIPHMRGGERYPVGMFSACPHDEYSLYPMSEDDLDAMWRGHDGGSEACNILQIYDHGWHDDWGAWANTVVQNVLVPLKNFNDANGSDLRVIIGTFYGMFVSADSSGTVLNFSTHQHQWTDHCLTDAGLADLTTYVTTLCAYENDANQELIAGWYLYDEPNLAGYDLAEYYKLVDAVRQLTPDKPIYGALHGPNWYHGLPQWRYDRWINWNGKMYMANTDDLPYVVNEDVGDSSDDGITVSEEMVAGSWGDFIDLRFPGEDPVTHAPGCYDSTWYFTMWEADHVMVDYYGPTYTLAGKSVPGWIATAREDMSLHGDSRSWEGDWHLHFILRALYGGYCEWGALGVDQLECFDEFPSHTDFHNNIRRMLDLNVDGIWFFGWHHTCSLSTPPCDGPASFYWLNPDTDWAEAVESEIEGRDQVLMVLTKEDLSSSFIDYYAIEDYEALQYGSLTDREPVYSSGQPGEPRAIAATAGDYDGDGDDEVIIAYTSEQLDENRLFLVETQQPEVSEMGDYELSHDSAFHVTALSSGDLDRDGDDELIMASSSGGESYTTNRLEVFEYSPTWKTTGNMRVTDSYPLWRVVYSGDTEDGYCSVAAAGDFDGNGADEIFVALTAVVGADEEYSVLYFIEAPTSTADPIALDMYTPVSLLDRFGAVTAMTSADYEGDGDDELLIATCGTLYDGDGVRVIRCDFTDAAYAGLRTGVDVSGTEIYHEQTLSYVVTALSSGDYDGEFDDETFLAMYDPYYNMYDGVRLYFLEDPTPSTQLGAWIAETPATYFHYKMFSMASGDFTPSELAPPEPPPPGGGGGGQPVPDPKLATDGLPTRFSLSGSSPNPFNATTTIAYELPNETPVRICVYDVSGRLVRTLVDRRQGPGRYSVDWDGADSTGTGVASGVYFCQMRAEDFTERIRIVALK